MAGRKYGLGKYGRGTYDKMPVEIVFPPWTPIGEPPESWIPISEPPPAWVCSEVPSGSTEIWKPVYQD